MVSVSQEAKMKIGSCGRDGTAIPTILGKSLVLCRLASGKNCVFRTPIGKAFRCMRLMADMSPMPIATHVAENAAKAD